ncbi:ABC transporter ATP-binding protein, partial [Streptomyces sp. SID8455]|nr:ABC transporter ATP-binding protein [Streptomyces sp. SID8455]
MSLPAATPPPPSPGTPAGDPVLELRALTRTHGSGIA